MNLIKSEAVSRFRLPDLCSSPSCTMSNGARRPGRLATKLLSFVTRRHLPVGGAHGRKSICSHPGCVQKKKENSPWAKGLSLAKAKEDVMVNMGVEPTALALLAPRSNQLS